MPDDAVRCWRIRVGPVLGVVVGALLALAFAARLAAATAPQLALESIAEGLVRPIMLTAPPGDSRRFLVERGGRIRVVTSDGHLLPRPFLDIGAEIGGAAADPNRRGLLGLAFAPGFRETGRFYVYQVGPVRADAPLARRLLWRATAQVAEMETDPSDPDLARAEPVRVPLALDLAADAPSGGALAMAADGTLVIGLGGGGVGARGEAASVAGAILAFDPFLGRTRIVARGLEDPRFCAFDRGGAGVLFCADGARRTIDLVVEGRAPPVVESIPVGQGCPAPPPATGCAPIGGYVYRGRALPRLVGHYVFGRADLGAMVASPSDGRGSGWTVAPLPLAGWPADAVLSGLGQDAAGELYVLTVDRRDPDGAGGKTFRIVPLDRGRRAPRRAIRPRAGPATHPSARTRRRRRSRAAPRRGRAGNARRR